MSKNNSSKNKNKTSGKIPGIGSIASSSFEPALQELFDLAFCGAIPIIKNVADPVAFFESTSNAASFFEAAHRGFWAAQNIVADRILDIEKNGKVAELKGELLVLRKVMDGIAWQLLQGQLYIARRLYKEQRPPALLQSNFDSVREVAKQSLTDNFSAFPLISDLTSFVQVGDLLIQDVREGRLTIVEVKEGEKNRKIQEFMQFFSKSQCLRSFQHFAELEGEKTVDQLFRTARQMARAKHVVDVLKNNKGVDPDTGLEVRVSESNVPLENYDDRLSQLMDKSNENGWAIDVIDNCLFIGAYRGIMRPAAGLMLSGWLEQCGGHPNFPICNILQSMNTPLGLPLFCRNLRQDQIFDLIFGRCVVMLGFHLNAFAELSVKHGLTAKWFKPKGNQRIKDIVTIDNKALSFEFDGNKSILAGGVIVRVFFHGMSPNSALTMMKHQLQTNGNQNIHKP